MAKRVVKAALFRYTDSDGSRRIAHFGDEVDLSKDELERGDRLGVFNPAPIPPVVSAAVDRALGDIESRVNEPVAVGDELPDPPHSITDAGSDSSSQEPDPVPGDADTPPAATDAPSTPETPKRPVKAAHIDVWRSYIVAATDITEEAAAKMSKDELQAAAPPEG